MENQITDFFYPQDVVEKIDLPHILRMHGKWIAKNNGKYFRALLTRV